MEIEIEHDSTRSNLRSLRRRGERDSKPPVGRRIASDHIRNRGMVDESLEADGFGCEGPINGRPQRTGGIQNKWWVGSSDGVDLPAGFPDGSIPLGASRNHNGSNPDPIRVDGIGSSYLTGG